MFIYIVKMRITQDSPQFRRLRELLNPRQHSTTTPAEFGHPLLTE